MNKNDFIDNLKNENTINSTKIKPAFIRNETAIKEPLVYRKHNGIKPIIDINSAIEQINDVIDSEHNMQKAINIDIERRMEHLIMLIDLKPGIDSLELRELYYQYLLYKQTSQYTPYTPANISEVERILTEYGLLPKQEEVKKKGLKK